MSRGFCRAISAIVAACCVALLAGPSGTQAAGTNEVVKATLDNGLRIVIVRNRLAPVIATDMTYLVGSRDDPAAYPGMAHAQEHMMFRGTKNLSTSQLGTIATALGGTFNAETSDTLTQYEFTVPAANFDAVLRIESDRMRDVLDSQAQWENERGAIEQEVLHDESAPGADFFGDVRRIAFAGTPYAREGVGTRAAFDRLTGPEIKAFHQKWYAPNNAVFVIAGDVDPATTLTQIRARFAAIPERAIPAHPAAHFSPLGRVALRRSTTLVYPLAVVAFRMPGIDSRDFLPSYVLQAILDSDRGRLHALADTGDALDAEWLSLPYFPQGQLAYATAALPPGADPSAMVQRLEAIVTDYAQHGVPPELFATTKRHLIADQELSRNSISALASDWATTIALDGEPSIEREQQLIANVTLDEVDRTAKRYLDVDHAILGALTPSARASVSAPPAPPQQGPEKPLAPQPPVTVLPPWANALVANVSVPPSTRAPSETSLPNGIRLIVQPETISDSVFVFGRVRTNAALQEPHGQEGVSSVLAALFALGTQTQDRATFLRAQDDIDTSLSAGYDFALQTTSQYAGRAIGLLAENELHPRFDQATFELAQRRAVEELQTANNGTGTQALRRAERLLLPAGDPTLREPTTNSLSVLTLDNVEAYDRKTLRPDLATIVVIGNIDPAAARAAVERDFGGWQATGERPALDLGAVPLNPPGNVHVPIPAGDQDAVSLMQIVPLARSAAAFSPLQLGNAILGGGALGPDQSRLFRDIRQNAGLVYSIGSQLSSNGARSRFTVSFACLPANAPRIDGLIDAEIEKMKAEPVGAFELSLMKASLVHRSLIGESAVASIGRSLLDAASDGLPLDEDRRDDQRVIASDAGAVQHAFAAYVHPKNFVQVVVGP